MTVAASIAAPVRFGAGNYEISRFNSLRHGVLSQHTVLPWEDGSEYRVLLEALAAEHDPQGPTEEHLVEEVAGVIWRKRRLRLGEAAAHHRALHRAVSPYQETAKAALVHIADGDDNWSAGDAIRATDDETEANLAELEVARAMTGEALRLLEDPSPSAYSRALSALPEDILGCWEDQLLREPDDHEESRTPYRVDAESLKRFLQAEILSWYATRQQELDHRSLIRTQAFGEAVDPARLERLARYEVHLDRKLERMLAMLLRLKDLRREALPG
jgi:hypothetical protein